MGIFKNRKPAEEKPSKLGNTLLFASAAGFAILANLTVFSANSIPTSSMEPELVPGEQVVVNKLDRNVKRGDIVVFKDMNNWMGLGPDALMIKRVIGLPGETVRCCGIDGATTVDGRLLDEPYKVREPADRRTEYEVTVPEDSYFVLGDNRPDSADSRFHIAEGTEFIHRDDLVGTAWAVRWPLSDIRSLPSQQYF